MCIETILFLTAFFLGNSSSFFVIVLVRDVVGDLSVHRELLAMLSLYVKFRNLKISAVFDFRHMDEVPMIDESCSCIDDLVL